MIENLNLVKAEMRNRKCLTFKEAEIILKPILGTDCLQEFLEKSGYIDDNGLPLRTSPNWKLFTIAEFESDHDDYISPGVVYWITSVGMASIFKKALIHYFKENVINVPAPKQQEQIINPLEITGDCFAF